MVVARRPARRLPILIAAIVVVVFLFSGSVARFYTDLLWFREVGKTPVFWGILRARLLLGAVAGLGTALLIWLNLAIAARISPRPRIHLSADLPTERYRVALGPYLRPLRIGVALVIGFLVALSSSAQWQTFLLWRNRVPFGQQDAQFHRDIGYFVFTLPFLRAVFGWLMFSLVLTTLITAAAHYLYGGIRPEQPGRRVAPQVQAHLSVLLGAIVLLKAWGYYLDRFSLNLSARGVVTGASYTDVHAQLPALKLLLVVAIICALLFFANIRIRSFLLPGIGVILLVVFAVALGGIYPTIVQRFQVAPQELQKERPYIQRNLDATRQAFALGSVDTKEFPAATDLTGADIKQNSMSIDNIRLWEPDILKTVFDSREAVGQTYAFEDVDVDRYPIDNAVRQVMIAPREVAPQNLQQAAQTWQNLHLTYTHGYGVVAAQVNRTVADGQPDLVDSGFDETNAKIPVTSPRIYFGEPAPDAPLYVVAKSKQEEVDTPQESGAQTTRAYDGTGGITMSNLLRRVAFALRFRDVNLLISGNIDAKSRLMFNRDIRTRLETVAPFLQWDADPYVAVVDKRIVYIRDGYTTTDNYPYSQRIDLGTAARLDPGSRGVSGPANYIRNSVKAVVDAYNGSVTLYAFDPADPLLKAYSKAFPGLFAPVSKMTPDLKAHLRYPEDLFSVQTDRYASYHIKLADDFYSKQDFWALPDDPSGDVTQGGGSQLAVGTTGPNKMRPYYLLTGLPQEAGEQFILVMPFTPNNRQNMVSYMAARSDPGAYGDITLFSLPRSQSVAGPTQVNATILQTPAISQELSLLNQTGSKVTLGNLLVVPIKNALLYVQPIFLQANKSPLPRLFKVATFYNNQVGYAPSLDASLDQIFGQGVQPPTSTTPGTPTTGGTGTPGVGTTVQQLLSQASAAYADAQAALKRGDLAAYQAKINQMGSLIQQAQQATNAPTATTKPTATTAPPR